MTKNQPWQPRPPSHGVLPWDVDHDFLDEHDQGLFCV